MNPRFYVIENPMAMLKHILGDCDHRTFFCIWLWPEWMETHDYKPPKKPTDLWYLLPSFVDDGPLVEPEWSWPQLIDGTWELAPRGTRKGIQRMKSSAERAMIPFRLSEFIRKLIEEHERKNLEDPIIEQRHFYDFADIPIPNTPK